MSGSGVLAGGQTGNARWLFVPTRDAALVNPTAYKIGGTLRYTENGVDVVVQLLPATITVFPDPLLSLDYFLQKDVYSDDPFTEAVEPSEPFALGVLVTNTGAGNARNFEITSGQPKIIENEKGLLIDFKIIGTQVGESVMNPSMKANFGTIPAGGSDSGVWYMTSTLQGRFIEYNASFTHVDDFGNPRTSLIDKVNFHELTHALKINATGYVDDHRFDFLANDIADADHAPDTLYLSSGEKFYVSAVNDGVASAPVTTSRLTVTLASSAQAGPRFICSDRFGSTSTQFSCGSPARTAPHSPRKTSASSLVWIPHRPKSLSPMSLASTRIVPLWSLRVSSSESGASLAQSAMSNSNLSLLSEKLTCLNSVRPFQFPWSEICL